MHTIGVNLHPSDQVRNIQLFEEHLQRIVTLGLDAVEIPVHGLDVLRNGQLDVKRLRQYMQVIEQYPLHITTHAPYDLNVFRKQDPQTELAVFDAALEISGALGASVMTYHVGRFISEEQFLYPQYWMRLDDDSREAAMEMEREWLLQMGDRAMGMGLTIGMENIRPFPDCPHYCYATNLDELLHQVQLINHPSVGITLDVGHLHLSAGMYGHDQLAQVARAASRVVHVHMHDNFGKPCYSVEKNQLNLLPFGRGDLHLPIGSGSVPMISIANVLLPHFDGVWLHEIRERYQPEWHLLRQRSQAFLAVSTMESEEIQVSVPVG